MENFVKNFLIESKGTINNFARRSLVKKNFFNKFLSNKTSISSNYNFSSTYGNKFSNIHNNKTLINFTQKNFCDVIIKDRNQAPPDPFLSSITAEAASEIQTLRSKINNRQKLPFEMAINLFNKLERLNLSQREDAETLLLDILRNDKFLTDYLSYPAVDLAHKNYSELFYNARKLKLSDEDLTNLQKLYFDLDKIPREFTIQERTKIFDAFYYYDRAFPKENLNSISKMKAHIEKSFLEFFTSFSHSEVCPIIQSIMFLPDEDVNVFTLRMVDKMNYVINPEFYEKMKLSTQKKLELIQFYPRILFTIKDSHPEIFEREKNRIENFLIESKKQIEDDCPSEMALCCISNFMIWTQNSPKLLEEYVPFFYRNLASFKPELTLELFFLLLNCDITKMTNPNKAISLINVIFQTIKNCPTTRLFTFEYVKEAFYFLEVREKLDRGFEQWDSKDKAEAVDHPEHYHKKILRSLVNKSSDLYPFSALKYDNNLFENIYTNFKKYIKF
jgi:hypothetical protein